MIKVALLHYDFKSYTVGLANGLAQQVELTIVHPKKLSDETDPVLDQRIHVYNFQKPRARSLSNLSTTRRLYQYIRNLKPDILHVQATNDPWFDTALIYDKLPPLVTTVHDVFQHPGDRFRVLGAGYTNRIPYYRSNHLIVHTEPLKMQLQQHFNRSPEQISVLQHGELGTYYHYWSDHRPVEREPYTLLFFGRIWPYKGLRYLIDAMPLVAAQIPQVKLIIAGRGENIERYFSNGIDPKRYEVLNRYIAQSEVVGLFQRSAVTVLPYIEASQSGVATIAYGLGTPVIACNIGGLGELVRDGEDGLLVPPADTHALADAIIRLLNSPDHQRQFATAGLARCQNDLSWSNIAKDTVRVYERTLEAM